jgi:hypothetical protein
VPLLKAGDGAPVRKSFAAAVAGVPVAGDAHQDFDPFGDEDHADTLGWKRRVAHQVLRVEADRVAVAVVAGTRESEAAAAIIGVGLVEAHLLAVAGTEFAGGRVEPTGSHGEFVLDHGEERIGVVDDVVLIRQRVFVSGPEICRLAGALADIGQVAVTEGHFLPPRGRSSSFSKLSRTSQPRLILSQRRARECELVHTKRHCQALPRGFLSALRAAKRCCRCRRRR